MRAGEGRVEVVPGDVAVVDVDTGEDGLVELAALVVVGVPVALPQVGLSNVLQSNPRWLVLWQVGGC